MLIRYFCFCKLIVLQISPVLPSQACPSSTHCITYLLLFQLGHISQHWCFPTIHNKKQIYKPSCPTLLSISWFLKFLTKPANIINIWNITRTSIWSTYEDLELPLGTISHTHFSPFNFGGYLAHSPWLRIALGANLHSLKSGHICNYRLSDLEIMKVCNTTKKNHNF